MTRASCIIPGCRIRGQHAPGCTDDDCRGCLPRTTDGAYACEPCTDRVRRALLGDDRHDDRPGLIDSVPAARDIAHGFSAHGGTGASGKPGSRMPLDLSVTARLDAVQGEMTTWARHVAETRSGRSPANGGGDPIVGAARYLATNLDWLAHRPEADEAYAAIHACARIVRGIVRGPAELKYLGPCGSTVTWDDDEQEIPRERPCAGDVYAYPAATEGRCRACKARWPVDARRAWLDEKTADLAAPARDIAYALDLNVNTIRTWAHTVYADSGAVLREAKLRTYYRLDEHVVPWAEIDPGLPEAQRKAIAQERGPRLHYVGDVRELARQAADRRAERERREAARHNEGAAA